MTTFKFETTGGDPVQQKRRAAMFDPYMNPEYWIEQANRSFLFSMRGHGNTPDVELRHVVDSLFKAHELGLPLDNGLTDSEQFRRRLKDEAPDVAEIWLTVGVALELAAQAKYASRDEAIASMEVSPV